MGAWTDSIPETLTYDGDGGAKLPMRDHPMVKESPDLGHFVNRAFTQHKELGSRIPVKVDKSKPDEVTKWRTDYLPKLYDAGVLERPPAKPEEYELKPGEAVEGIVWNPERAKRLTELGVKHGISKQALQDLVALHRESLIAAIPELQTNYEASIEALKKEFGADYEAVMEDTKRLTAIIFKDPKELEFMNATGLGNHPIFLSILGRLSKYAKQDSSMGLDTVRPGSENANGGGVSDADKAKSELTDIQTNKNNPRYEGFWRNDAAVNTYINELYKKAFPGQVTL